MYSQTSFEWFSIVSNTFDVKRQCLPNEVANMKSINVKWHQIFGHYKEGTLLEHVSRYSDPKKGGDTTEKKLIVYVFKDNYSM